MKSKMVKIIRRAALVLLIAALVCGTLSGCRESGVTERSFLRMDTVVTVRVWGADDPDALLDACDERLSSLDATLSATAPESDVGRFNTSADGSDVTMQPATAALIERALALGAACGGAFDVTVAPYGALWKRCEAEGRLPTDGEIVAARAIVGAEHLGVTDGIIRKDAPDVRIDLGGIGKGYAADELLALLSASDATGGLIHFGSNVAVFGQKPDGSPFRIALRDPNDPTGTIGTLTLHGGVVLSVSGDYERYYEIDGHRYGHIQNPATGYPPDNGLRSVAVLAADGVTADVLSTALMVLGEDAGRALLSAGTLSFEAVFVYDDRVSMTDGITLE